MSGAFVAMWNCNPISEKGQASGAGQVRPQEEFGRVVPSPSGWLMGPDPPDCSEEDTCRKPEVGENNLNL